MGEQREVRVREVAVREVRREVPEAAVVRLADEGDPPHERLGRFWGGRDALDEAEPVQVLPRRMSSRWRRAEVDGN